MTAVLPPCVMHTFFRIANILLQTAVNNRNFCSNKTWCSY